MSLSAPPSALGHYHAGVQTALLSTTFGATSELWQFRWNPRDLFLRTKYDGSAGSGTFTITTGTNYNAGSTLTLTASAAAFQGTAGDVGDIWRVVGADGSTLDLTVTAASSTTVCSATAAVAIPASLQNTATSTWYMVGGHDGYLCDVHRVTISMCASTVYAAGPYAVALVKCTGWTAQAVLGLAPSGFGLFKKKGTADESRMAVMGEQRTCSTDNNGLGAGTKTMQTSYMGVQECNAPTAAPLTMFPPGTVLFDESLNNDKPITLNYQEGLTLLTLTTPASGNGRLALNIDWSEYAGPKIP